MGCHFCRHFLLALMHSFVWEINQRERNTKKNLLSQEKHPRHFWILTHLKSAKLIGSVQAYLFFLSFCLFHEPSSFRHLRFTLLLLLRQLAHITFTHTHTQNAEILTRFRQTADTRTNSWYAYRQTKFPTSVAQRPALADVWSSATVSLFSTPRPVRRNANRYDHQHTFSSGQEIS